MQNSSSSKSIDILLIEDNPGDANLIDIYLRESFDNKYLLTIAGYLSKGLELLTNKTFDVVILDLSLPDSKGLDSFKKIYEQASGIPVIVLTGIYDESIGINALQYGAQDFLVKGQIKSSDLKRSINYSIERNKLQNELTEQAKKLEAQKKADELINAKEQFLANMSHEIRTPMNAIIGFTDLILKTDLTPDQKQYVEAIKTSGKDLLVIINDILDYSKIQSGRIVFEQKELRIPEVISAVHRLMLPMFIEKNIRFVVDIEKNIPDSLVGDSTRLNQILVGNAYKFTKQGEVKIKVDLIEELPTAVELRFSVIDTGIGIPENMLSSIFERFTQVTTELKNKEKSTGLGLNIVKQLVELQGGSFFVESKVDVGSAFSFKIKFNKNHHLQQEENTILKEENIMENVEGLNILVVEDNLLNQVLTEKVLQDWKWNVDIAENGLVAIEKLKQKGYDVILMDIQLPEMNGYESTQHIRKDFPFPKCNTPIIAMTANALSGEIEKCLEAGMNDYISKPFDQKAMYNKILSIYKNNGLRTSKCEIKENVV